MALPPSYKDKVIASRADRVHRIRATDSTGRRAYYVLLAYPLKERTLMQLIEGGKNFDLKDYGDVIASCYGEEPTEEIKTILKDKYNIEA